MKSRLRLLPLLSAALMIAALSASLSTPNLTARAGAPNQAATATPTPIRQSPASPAGPLPRPSDALPPEVLEALSRYALAQRLDREPTVAGRIEDATRQVLARAADNQMWYRWWNGQKWSDDPACVKELRPKPTGCEITTNGCDNWVSIGCPPGGPKYLERSYGGDYQKVWGSENPEYTWGRGERHGIPRLLQA
jgi:hypothetical protein